METVNLSFNVSKKARAMFDLLADGLGLDDDKAFERIVSDRFFAFESLIMQEGKGDAKNQLTSEGSSKVIRRMPIWARNVYRINHQCIRAFLLCEKDGVANKNEMCEVFVKYTGCSSQQFYSNMVNLTTDSGNSSGRLFKITGDEVTVVDEAKKALDRFKDCFKHD